MQPIQDDLLATSLGPLPAVRAIADAPSRIRASRAAAGRRTAVLDDDPTGSQTVHDIGVVTVLEADALAAELASPGICFVLTNTRSLPQAAAEQLTTAVAGMLADLEDRYGGRIDVISRSDSTLRGHAIAELGALDAVRRQRSARGYDAILLAPAYFEAGRFTAGDVHWARVGDSLVPVGETEFASDPTFGYVSSNLRDFVAEKSSGAIRPQDVRSIGLEDIRLGGPARVAEILLAATGGVIVVVNATCYEDLDVVVLGMLAAEAQGRTFLPRTGPSFVRSFAGLGHRAPLAPTDIWPDGHPGGHGLVVVGSHVGLTSRQLEVAQQAGDLADVELDVIRLMDPDQRDADVADAANRVIAALAHQDVVLSTSRTLARGVDADASLQIARTVSSAVVDVVRSARAAAPAWVLAKGGITSHDVAVRGLGMRRAEVVGQMLPGLVSLWRAVDAAPEIVGRPYVVFAGNVGDETTLAHVIQTLRAPAPC